MAVHFYNPRRLPPRLEALAELAVDLRWTWTDAADQLWRTIDRDIWDATENPWLLLQEVSQARLDELERDDRFCAEVARLVAERHAFVAQGGAAEGKALQQAVAYFSMEFGVGAAVPFYAGGLGILAGDLLKAASDLGLPLIGIGLMYQEGYFRQSIDPFGRQEEIYPYVDPTTLPIQPAQSADGGWLRIAVPFPGRLVWVRIWQATIGRVTLYLLDSNDPFNSPRDRGITARLYGGGSETRLKQELLLGIAGWRALGALGLRVGLCHLNEGHAAFVTLERAHSVMREAGLNFRQALWATRPGNVFTTHTPVRAGFDVFEPALLARYFRSDGGYLDELGISLDEFLALGRANPADRSEPFTTAFLAMRTCGYANGVSRRHGEVSRRLFAPLFPRRPEHECPIGHITNGVHTPTWISLGAEQRWTAACGDAHWLAHPSSAEPALAHLSDEAIWSLRSELRANLVAYARERLANQLATRGAPAEDIARARRCLDDNVLTLGFARRFTEYKRPNLLLRDPQRLRRLLANPQFPVQLIVSGKAHPADELGKQLVSEWVHFVADPAVRSRAIFIEDYDMASTFAMVQGVDVWLNTPRPPWEACGTSGMKVLVNGGLNLSVLDGWWAEAFSPAVGWCLAGDTDQDDNASTQELFRVLEQEVVPLFYSSRNASGTPPGWITRIRQSMSRLAPLFSATRMVRDYVAAVYQPGERELAKRNADGGSLARRLDAWASRVRAAWPEIAFGPLDVRARPGQLEFSVAVHLGPLSLDDVRVELYADAPTGGAAVVVAMDRAPDVGPAGGHRFVASVSSPRPASDFTPRIVPFHPDANATLELPLILWRD